MRQVRLVGYVLTPGEDGETWTFRGHVHPPHVTGDTMKKSEVLRIRRKMCLEIAEWLETEYGLRANPQWNVDKAARLIGLVMPLTYAEAQAEWDALTDDAPAKPQGAGVLDRLRDALGLAGAQPPVPLKEVLEAAIERITAGG